MFIQLFISLYCDHKQQGATLGPPNPIVTAGEEEEYEVGSILRHCWWGASDGIFGALARL